MSDPAPRDEVLGTGWAAPGRGVGIVFEVRPPPCYGVPPAPAASHFVSAKWPQYTISCPLVLPLLTKLVSKMLATAEKLII